MVKGKSDEVGRLTVQYINRYPNAYKRTIARIMVDERPDVFKSIENARDSVRYYLEEGGKASRNSKKRYTPNTLFSKLQQDPDQKLPDLRLNKGKALIIGDVHSFKLSNHIQDYFRIGKEQGVDTIILNGDIWDMDNLSRWPMTKRQTPFEEEMAFMHEFYDDIADHFPNERKIFKKGNHELWYDKQLWVNPKLMQSDLADALTLENVMNLEAKGFETLQDRQLIWLGKLLLVHGHEARKGGMYIAKAMLEYFKCDVAFGHFHRVDYHQFQPYDRPLMRAYGLPCARDLNAHYTGVNNQWKAGFAICEFDEKHYTMDVYVEDEGRIRRL